MDKLNYFLVAHLKAVPLDRLPQKIRETFATIDLDQSGQLSKAEVLYAIYQLSIRFHITSGIPHTYDVIPEV